MYFCKVCSQLDAQGISGHHVRCKPAINTKAINKVAINECTTNEVDQSSAAPDVSCVSRKSIPRSARLNGQPKSTAKVVGESSETNASQGLTKNRRKREDYNAYMKEYMRKRRAG